MNKSSPKKDRPTPKRNSNLSKFATIFLGLWQFYGEERGPTKTVKRTIDLTFIACTSWHLLELAGSCQKAMKGLWQYQQNSLTVFVLLFFVVDPFEFMLFFITAWREKHMMFSLFSSKFIFLNWSPKFRGEMDFTTDLKNHLKATHPKGGSRHRGVFGYLVILCPSMFFFTDCSTVESPWSQPPFKGFPTHQCFTYAAFVAAQMRPETTRCKDSPNGQHDQLQRHYMHHVHVVWRIRRANRPLPSDQCLGSRQNQCVQNLGLSYILVPVVEGD